MTTWLKIIEAVLELTEDKGKLLGHIERPWSSATFCGARHDVTLSFDSAEAVEIGEAFLVKLPAHEFDLPGVLVAEAKVICSHRTMSPVPTLTTQVQLLLVEYARAAT